MSEGRYLWLVEDLAVEFDVDRLRRKGDELTGELTVRCHRPGARTVSDDVLSVADLNLSSQQARQTRAKHLAERARAGAVDWQLLLEEFVQRVLAAERRGQPAVLLRDLVRPAPDDVALVEGFPLLVRHPTVLFGDGGGAKSYLALLLAGRLAQQGRRVGLFDWELAGEDHRERAERLFGSEIPRTLWYARCSRPLVHEADRLRKVVRELRLDFAIFDSIAFACDGPPEAAEVAGRYFQALRQLGPLGSLHVAHISKAEGADKRPFGSAFWHNGARSSWFVRPAEPGADSGSMTIGLYHRKANTGPLRPALGYSITFGPERTTFQRVDLTDTPDLAAQLPIRLRLVTALRAGARSLDDLVADGLGTKDAIRMAVKRSPGTFRMLDGGLIGLAER